MESYPQNSTSSRTARRAKYASNAIISILFLVIFLVALNWLLNRAPLRVDLSRNQIFTTSKATENLLAGLDDRVNIVVYATEQDIPSYWLQRKQELRELLTEFRRKSNRQVQFTFKDPSANPEVKTEAEQAGIEAQSMQQASATEATIKVGYLGLTAEFKGEKETISVILPNSPLEYQLARTINKLAQVDTPKVALMAPQGNPMMGQGGQFQIITQTLGDEGFEVLPINPESPEDFSEAKLLMILDPPSQLSDETLFKIDQFVMKGGSLFVGAPGAQMSNRMGQPSISPGAPNINILLQKYGLRINENLVEDWKDGIEVPVRSRVGQLAIVKNPLLFKATNFSKESPITAKISSGAFMAFTSSVSQSDNGTSATVTPLLKSSENSRLQEQVFNIDPVELRPPATEEELKDYGLIMMAKGHQKSRYADGTVPVFTSDDGTTRTVGPTEIVTETTQSVTIIVQGSALSYSDNIIQQFFPNIFLPLNIAESTARGGGFLEMRGKQFNLPTLKSVTESQALTTQGLIILGIPALIILLGIIKYIMHRMKMARYRREYGTPTAATD